MRRRPMLALLWRAGWAGGLGMRAPQALAEAGGVGAPRPPQAPVAADIAPVETDPPRGVSHRSLRFPADHGAHPDTRVEWWYITGWLRRAGSAAGAPAGDAAHRPDFGFQATFFRRRTGLAEQSASRFAARQLVFAHVAFTDLAARAAWHDQRIAREGFGIAQVPAPTGAQVARLRDWSLSRAPASASEPSALQVSVRCDHFMLDLALHGTQPLLLQGEGGYSRKGPLPEQASHYYSEPQLAVRGHVQRAAPDLPAADAEVVGRAWLDHEWSDEYLPAEALGWDWIGFNLFDGGALMAFRQRRADGSALWAGGSHRDAAGAVRIFAASELAFRPLRLWTSPRTQVRYPVEWRIETPVGAFRVAALLDDQELDSRSSTGSLYWEGVAGLQAEDGRVLGWGYLELTGYAERLRM
jgi:predicted secreted hydrolase